MLRSNCPEGSYVNGSIGAFEGWRDTYDADNSPCRGALVKLAVAAGEPERWVTAPMTKWERMGAGDNGQTQVLGSMRQIPLSLAYAATIHKAQGQTLDSVNIMLGKKSALRRRPSLRRPQPRARSRRRPSRPGAAAQRRARVRPRARTLRLSRPGAALRSRRSLIYPDIHRVAQRHPTPTDCVPEQTQTTIAQAAQAYLDKGFSVVPCRLSNKKPLGKWKMLQSEPMAPNEAARRFASAEAVALIGGAVSGGFEVLDFDVPVAYDDWIMLMRDHAPELLARLPIISTPSGGRHVYLRSDAPDGNQKLALYYVPDRQIAIETRGEGGYVLAAPSPGYERISEAKSVPHLTADERDLVMGLARSLDSTPMQSEEPAPASSPDSRPEGEVRPGDDFNERGHDEAKAVLRKHGWTLLRTRGDGVEEWVRPGKKGADGLSATYGYEGAGKCFFVFSTNAPGFENVPRKFDPMGIFTRLEFGGDFAAATRELSKRGYGSAPHEKARPAKLSQTRGLTSAQPSGDGQAGVAPELDDASADEHDSWPYVIEDDRLSVCKKSRDTIAVAPIIDATAYLAHEVTDESGDRAYRITGKAIRGGGYTCEIGAIEFESPRDLSAALGAALGGLDAVYPRMSERASRCYQEDHDDAVYPLETLPAHRLGKRERADDLPHAGPLARRHRGAGITGVGVRRGRRYC